MKNEGLCQPYITDHLKSILELSHFAHTLGTELKNKDSGCYEEGVASFLSSRGITLAYAIQNKAIFGPDQQNIISRENQDFPPYERRDFRWQPLGTSRYDHNRDQRAIDRWGELEAWIDENLRIIESTPIYKSKKSWSGRNTTSISSRSPWFEAASFPFCLNMARSRRPIAIPQRISSQWQSSSRKLCGIIRHKVPSTERCFYGPLS